MDWEFRASEIGDEAFFEQANERAANKKASVRKGMEESVANLKVA
jgi:hypothetical protein